MLPFGVSICALSAAQAVVAASPGCAPRWVTALRARVASLEGAGWALVPAASVVVVIAAIRAASGVADGLTYLALVAVPPLAALALRPGLLAAALLFAAAWAGRGELWGDTAALVLSGASCVTLGALLAAVAPARALALGLLAMAAIDTALVVSDLLGPPNNVLNRAHPAAGLPRLQRAHLGSAVMGYGDLFAAALAGALAVAGAGRPAAAGSGRERSGELRRRASRTRVALALLALALGMDLLFLAVDELPATVPPALALAAVRPELIRRSRRAPR